MSNVLSPNAKQQFFDNNGRPAVGYQLFTYQAGTTTKADTYITEGSQVNANPIILNYRGECDLWIPPNVAYKYVLAFPNDTDPPANPIWSVDDVVSSQLITLYGGVDTGSVNAYVLNFDANFSSYVNGTVIYWLPANTNTGASTLNVNGLGPLAILDQNGAPLGAGAIIANQIATVIVMNGQFRLLSVSLTVGNFTATLTGMTGSVTGTIDYTISGGVCTLYSVGNITGTSNTTAMTMTGVPAICRPTVQVNTLCSDLVDNSISVIGSAGIGIGGSVVFSPFAVSGTKVVPGAFVNSGSKGISAGWSVTYPL